MQRSVCSDGNSMPLIASDTRRIDLQDAQGPDADSRTCDRGHQAKGKRYSLQRSTDAQYVAPSHWADTFGSLSAGPLVVPGGKAKRNADMALRSSPSPILAQKAAR